MQTNPPSDRSPHSAVRPLRQSHGFTLLELIIVMFLVALLFGMATVFLVNSLPAGKFNAAVRDLGSAIRHARSLAQVNGTAQAVVLDLDGKRFGISGKVMKPFPPDVMIRVQAPFSEDVTTGTYSFHFSPSGGSDGGTIVLMSAKRKVRIELDPVAGAIVVRE
ncbi:MAG: prepilin-type N-terminal cleavage/methylation domain-containing protein [Nitrospirae bacterium]|nr:MAG: prepilin-type N-terminal cleavage/methylation domain-containing protein [Nitrospirota bacterium]